MAGWMLVLTGVCYVIGGIDQLWKRDFGHAVMFGGYALANVGLWFAVK